MTKYLRESVERLSVRKSHFETLQDKIHSSFSKKPKEIPTLTINLTQDSNNELNQDVPCDELTEKEIDLGVFGFSLNKKLELIKQTQAI